MDENGANADDPGSLADTQNGVSQECHAQAFAVKVSVNCQPSQNHHRNGIRHVAADSAGSIGMSDGACGKSVIADDPFGYYTTYVRDAPLASFCRARRTSEPLSTDLQQSNSAASCSEESFGDGKWLEPRSYCGVFGVPGSPSREEAEQARIVLRRTVEKNGEAFEGRSRDFEIAPVEEHRFGFAAYRVQHEVGPGPSERLSGLIDKHLLFSTGSEIEGLIRRTFGLGFTHGISIIV
jgi:hypothetical protein